MNVNQICILAAFVLGCGLFVLYRTEHYLREAAEQHTESLLRRNEAMAAALTTNNENGIPPVEIMLNAMAAVCHTRNYQWWHDHDGKKLDLNVGERLMLTVSELSEAMEGHRKGLMDDHLPTYKMFDVEIADSLIRLFDIAGAWVPQIGEIAVEKMRYNARRADHKMEVRMRDGGKKY